MKSIYIHIPFCSDICSYCDFTKLYHLDKYINSYFMSLEQEVKKRYQGELIETLYIGGGTPSCLTIEEMKCLFSIINIFNLSKTVEFTVECNINDITEEKLQLMKENKVNRLSIGVQSFDTEILKYLNRKYTKEQIVEKIIIAKKYFSNISIDLIYAVSGQTIKQLNNDLKEFLSLDIPHISTYSLMIEPHTILKNTNPIDEDMDFEMYENILKILKKNNYNHYEISNFSKRGYESKHNLTYWNNEEYYGFGLGASGYIESVRYDNTKSFNEYIKGIYRKEEIYQTSNMKIENEFILGLRKIEGININQFKDKYGIDIKDVNGVKDLISSGKLTLMNDYLYIPSSHWYLANDILINFIS